MYKAIGYYSLKYICGYADGSGSTWFLALKLGRKGKGLLLMYLPGIFPTVRNLQNYTGLS